MKNYLAKFADMAWETTATGVRQKLFKQGEKSLRLLQFDKAMQHPQWCMFGHMGYVLEGTLEVAFERQTVIYRQGDGLIIPPGDADRHKPRAVTASVTLFLIDYSRQPL